MFLSLRNKTIRTTKEFMREVIAWLAFIIVLQGVLALVASKMGFTVDVMVPALFGLKTIFFVHVGLFVLQGLLIFSIVYMLKQVHYWAALALLFVSLLISALSMKQELMGFVIQLGICLALVFYGYHTKKDLSHWGCKRTFVALIIIAALILSVVGCGFLCYADFFSQPDWKDLISTSIGGARGIRMLLGVVALLVLAVMYLIIFLRLIAFDTQKIKNIDLNIVKTDNQVARSAILLCALTFFLDFSLSIFRVLLPWGEKK